MKRTYKLIKIPVKEKLKVLSKRELEGYFDWFISVIPERIDELAAFVRTTERFQEWRPDNSRQSVEVLGDWMEEAVTTRTRTEAEMLSIKSRAPFLSSVANEELSSETFSLAMDIGMYLGCALLNNFSILHWDQEIRMKSSINYGHAVLSGFGKVSLNPIQVVVVHAYGLVDKKNRTKRRLIDIYDVWARKIDPGSS